MANSSFDRDALRRNLAAALSESLVDIGDNIEDIARRAQANMQGQNPFAARPTFFSASSSNPAQLFFPQHQQQPQLLLAVARQQEQARLLEHARAAVIVAQEQERMLVQQSYRTLLQNKLCVSSGPPSFPKITDALRNSLFSQVTTQQQPNNLAALVSQETIQNHRALALSIREGVLSGKVNNTISPTKALEALGSRLRNAVDPYIDVSSIVDEPRAEEEDARQGKRTRGGVTEPFPEKLHRVLKEVEAEGKTDVVSFFSHGRAFAVHDMERFVEEIMPRFFKQSKWNSFARQLNLYGFQRLLTGPDAGGYYHELFLKGRPSLAVHMRRVGVPHGKDRRKFKQPQARTLQPDFYAMKKLASES